MSIKTGLKWLIGLSVVGITIATVLILTCPFAGVISFSTLVREGTKSYQDLTVHATAIPGVRELPAKVMPLFGSEVSFLGIVVLVAVILFSWLILKGKSLTLFGYRMNPQFMGLGILLIAFWNLFFGAFLIGVEVIALKEL
ncbi:MAG: hypothetical protein ACE5G5_09745 [Candidatus Methylomirabilales bacterium]